MSWFEADSEIKDFSQEANPGIVNLLYQKRFPFLKEVFRSSNLDVCLARRCECFRNNLYRLLYLVL